MPAYKIGVIGHSGRGDYGHGLDLVWKSIPSCKIVAVADADQPGLDEARKRLQVDRGYLDYRQMLDEAKPDIVSVGPRWIDQHRDMVVAAAERGVHVYMEKPFCRTPREADEIVAACEQHQTKLAIAFQTRYSPKLSVVRHLIEDGAIGRILEWRGRGKEDARGGGEDLWVLGSHIMNLMHYFAGEPDWCFAKIWREGRPISAADVKPGSEGIGPLAGDNVQAMFGFPDGATGFFASRKGMGPGGTGRFGLHIVGQLGQIELLPGYLPSVYLLQDALWAPGRSGKSWQPVSSLGAGKPEPLQDGGLAAGNVLACQDLLAAIEENRQPEANMYEARKTVEMISAVFASQVAGGLVKFPLVNRDNPLTRFTGEE